MGPRLLSFLVGLALLTTSAACLARPSDRQQWMGREANRLFFLEWREKGEKLVGVMSIAAAREDLGGRVAEASIPFEGELSAGTIRARLDLTELTKFDPSKTPEEALAIHFVTLDEENLSGLTATLRGTRVALQIPRSDGSASVIILRRASKVGFKAAADAFRRENKRESPSPRPIGPTEAPGLEALIEKLADDTDSLSSLVDGIEGSVEGVEFDLNELRAAHARFFDAAANESTDCEELRSLAEDDVAFEFDRFGEDKVELDTSAKKAAELIPSIEEQVRQANVIEAAQQSEDLKETLAYAETEITRARTTIPEAASKASRLAKEATGLNASVQKKLRERCS